MPQNSVTKTHTPENAPNLIQHRVLHDVYAIILGTCLISVGLVILKQAGVVTAGLSGWSFLLTKLTNHSFGTILFAISIPFYIFAYWLMGIWFTVRTLIVITVSSLAVDYMGVILNITVTNALLASMLGGTVSGLGLLAIMRHGMSFGGFSVLGAWLQHKNIMRAGLFMMMADGVLVLWALFIYPLEKVIFSLVSMVCVNLVLIFNHKSEWYVSTSRL